MLLRGLPLGAIGAVHLSMNSAGVINPELAGFDKGSRYTQSRYPFSFAPFGHFSGQLTM